MCCCVLTDSIGRQVEFIKLILSCCLLSEKEALVLHFTAHQILLSTCIPHTLHLMTGYLTFDGIQHTCLTWRVTELHESQTSDNSCNTRTSLSR